MVAKEGATEVRKAVAGRAAKGEVAAVNMVGQRVAVARVKAAAARAAGAEG
jgi:hypothetical protein